MKAKPLIQTNPYLKDPVKRQELNKRSVRSSCGVEGIEESTNTKTYKIVRREKKLFDKLKAKFYSE